MKRFLELNTEGVLIIASTKGLKEYYAVRDFEYGFPDDLFELFKEGIIFAAVTDESIHELIIITDDTEEVNLLEYKILANFNVLNVLEDDRILVLDHATFTQICDWNHGDYHEYENRNNMEYIDINLDKSLYQIHVYQKLTQDSLSTILLKFSTINEFDQEIITLDPLSIYN
jgi:hypothetical protein